MYGMLDHQALRVCRMTEVFATAHVEGLGRCYVSQADRPDYLKVRVIKTGLEYLRKRKDVIFQPAKHV